MKTPRCRQGHAITPAPIDPATMRMYCPYCGDDLHKRITNIDRRDTVMVASVLLMAMLLLSVMFWLVWLS